MSALNPVFVVFASGAVTALATGLGAIPFVFVKSASQAVQSHAKAIASGLMLGASLGLVSEGTGYGSWQTVVGALAGVVAIVLTQKLLGGHEVSLTDVEARKARQMVLMVVVMTAHSFAEGVAVGVSFGGTATLASIITIAIAIHNIPEGLAISAVLRSRGKSVLACAGWSVFSSLPQPLMAVPAFVFVEAFAPALPYGLGFAAGAMIFMVLVELLPEAYEDGRKPSVALLVSLSLVAMILFQRSI